MNLPNRQRSTPEKLGDFVLRTEPLWPVPLYFLLLFDSPFLWVGWIIALVPWPLRRWRKGYLFPRTLFDIPIAIFMIGAIVGLIYSNHTAISIVAFQSYICVVFFYYAIAAGDWIRDWKLWGVFWVLFALLISVFVFSQIPITQSYTSTFTPLNAWFIRMLPSLPEIFAFRANVNSLAIILAMIIPVLFGVSIFGIKAHFRIRVGSIIVTILFIILLIFTSSRGGWIATGIALFFILSLRTKWALVLIPIAVGTIIWLWQTAYDPFNMLQLGDSGSLRRIEIWQLTIQMLKDYPLLGCGLGAFPIVFLPLAELHYWFPVSNPHNAYLMLYTDMGILGALTAFLAFTILMITMVKLWKRPRNQPVYGMAVGIVAGLIALGIHGVFEASGAAIWLDGAGGYHYLASPAPWFVAGNLAIAIKKMRIRE